MVDKLRTKKAASEKPSKIIYQPGVSVETLGNPSVSIGTPPRKIIKPIG
jgi:hypothetical protein